MKKLFLTTVFLMGSILAFASLEDAAVTEDAQEKAVEEVVVDFLKLRNPFLSQLPQEEILKTPVEHPIQTIDNSKKNHPVVETMPIPKIEEKPIVFPKIVLQGVVYDVKEPQVIIEDQSFSIGEHVLGAMIQSISKKGVTFSYEGKEFSVDLEN